MSYSCLISFKKISPVDVIPFLVSFKKNCTAHLKDIANEEYAYCPFVRDNLRPAQSFGDVTITERKSAQAWAHELFKFKYFYNTQFGLLGVFGVPTPLRNLFDGTVHFQNSTDQDYTREDYAGIVDFEAIFTKWATMSDADFREEYAKRNNGESFDAFIENEYPEYLGNEIQIDKKRQYYKRSYCYQEIWSHFESHLWNEDENIFFSVYGSYERNEVMIFIKHCHEAYGHWWKNYEETCSQHGD